MFSWKSSKQTCITRPTMEAEFIALEKASSEAEWVINLLSVIPLWTRPTSYVSMRSNSQGTTKAKSKMFNGKNKHIRLRHIIVRKLLETRVIPLDSSILMHWILVFLYSSYSSSSSSHSYSMGDCWRVTCKVRKNKKNNKKKSCDISI